MDYSLPGSSVHGIFQARILERVAVSYSRESSQPRDQTHTCLLCFRLSVLVTQLCLTFWDPMNCSSHDSSVHGILQARILEWVAIPFSKGIYPTQGSNPGLLHCRQILYHLSYQGSWVVACQRRSWIFPVCALQFSASESKDFNVGFFPKPHPQMSVSWMIHLEPPKSLNSN